MIDLNGPSREIFKPLLVADSARLCGSLQSQRPNLEERSSQRTSRLPFGAAKPSTPGGEGSSEASTSFTPPSAAASRRIDQPYSEIVARLIRSKENMGVLDQPDAQGFFMGSCGDRMQIDLRIINGNIVESGFLADGCSITTACGSMITMMACQKTLDQARQITPEDLLSALGGLPADHQHCAELAVMTLRDAVLDATEGHGSPRMKER